MSFKCRESCCDCCGPIPFTIDVFEKHKHKIKGKYNLVQAGNLVSPMGKDGICAFVDPGTKKCLIYENRPDICRKYGIDPAIPCPHLNRDGTRKNRRERRFTMRLISKRTDMALKLVERRR